MIAQERISLTGLPHESLSARLYPDKPESPTLGQLHALNAVANGFLIADDIKQAVINSATRNKENLQKTIDSWNKQISLVPGLAQEQLVKILGFKTLQDEIISSYGSSRVEPAERRRLIEEAFELLRLDISSN